MDASVELLEQRINYQFRDRTLLQRALTHRSWSAERFQRIPAVGGQTAENSSIAGRPHEGRRDNEQFEFLGDAILGFVVSEALLKQYPAANEGQLSQWKAHLVSANYLFQCARSLQLGDHLLLGKGEDRNGGRERRTLLANAFEAVIAAIYLDGGFEPTRNFILAHVLKPLDDENDLASFELSNYKSILQEEAQSQGLPTPKYTIVGTSGPEHAKVFTVEVAIGSRFRSRAAGSSKKTASQLAAQMLIEQLRSSESPAEDSPKVESSIDSIV
ncbi:MAG: ribonuclease III [Acidobacteriaceae bacterium]|nr:ribonuclease III [Acidobacteriaceae bacterium]MBV9222415.1 ribonuclease III [Acidobacteriaceae bacterium]